MADLTGAYFTEGSELKETQFFEPKIFETGVVVYEVVRVINGIVLFLEDHFNRLQHSISLSGYSYDLSFPVIHHILRSLIKKNGLHTGNIKIMLRFDMDQHPSLYSYFIPHCYPDPSMYQNGVETEFFRAERIDPNIKRINPALIERISTFIKTENLYDALLVSEGETIMEGSKTNVFFIRDNSVYTAPGSLVLKGITRQKVFELCKNLRFQIEEMMIPAMDLQTFDAAFFSGTSPKILPISRIANIRFQPNHEILRLLMHAYEEMIAAYMMKKNRMLHASG